jgi:F420-non-reducing hydrogenase large subunit
MSKRITIDPVTRLEGHGKIEIFLTEEGDVERAHFQVPELRGFEAFVVGRPAEEMPRLTSKICGVCPTAHHICSAKALDDLYKVEPPPAAKKLRELMYSAFILEDHLLHLFFLGGVDFIVGPTASPAERNILGVIAKVGQDVVRSVIKLRKECRDIITCLGGRVIHPVSGLPGGVSKAMTEDERQKINDVGKRAVAFVQNTCTMFESMVLRDETYHHLLMADMFTLTTYDMGMVDEQNKVSFYHGDIRVMTPDGKEFLKFKPKDYLLHIAEHVETWSYSKYPYLREIGWQGFIEGIQSGVYRVAPLARLNVAEGMATPLAQIEYEKLFRTLGGKPVHNILAFHWARLIEALYAAERLLQLSQDEEITDPHIRNIPTANPAEGVGLVEAPRGTLIHHYKTDSQGVITEANLIVATLHNAAAICMSIEKAARHLIRRGDISDGLLNTIEMAFRAYDPCLACATHVVNGGAGLSVCVGNHNADGIRAIPGGYLPLDD